MLHDYLGQICDAYSDGISISDKDGTIVLLNKKHAELTGLSAAALMGKPVSAFLADGTFDVVLNPRIVETKEPASAVQSVANGRHLVLTGYPILDAGGAVQYVITFIRDVTVLKNLRNEVARQRELLSTLEGLTKDSYKKAPVITCGSVMEELYRQVDTVAQTDATVLLLGETGVGKDVVARAVHDRSSRADKVFIKVDCGAIPENLIETELFGYVGGTFSGANKQGKTGLIEAADSGTLFFDEIGELPQQVQSRLLRFLQDHEIMRVGATTTKAVDARIIAATNRDLQKAVESGMFRSDLYYRLKVAELHIPPLRGRRREIPALVKNFLDFYNAKYEKSVRFAPEALRVMERHLWPGNVRELQNMVQQLVIMSRDGMVDECSLPFKMSDLPPTDSAKLDIPSVDIEGKSYKEIMRELEQAVIRAGMTRYGSITETARHFQLDRSTVFRKTKEHQIE